MKRFIIACLAVVAFGCSPATDTQPVSNSPAGVTDGKADSISGGSDETPLHEATPHGRLDSREFKVMLEPSLFSGGSVEEMLGYLQDEIDSRFPMEAEDLELTELRKERTVQYFDIPGSCDLRANGYSLRRRVKEGDHEVTLKYRSPERYLASAGDVTSGHPDAESKFEEDVKPGYASVYSRSTDVPVPADLVIDELEDAAALYEGVDRTGLDLASELAPVAGLLIHERNYGRLKYDLGEFKAKMDVTLWYFDPEADPIIAELSFKYEEDEDDFDVPSVRNGQKLFEVIQALQEWRATDSTTKTSFVYGYDSAFCGGATK